MKAYAIAVALLLVLVGCRKEPQAPVEVEKPEPPAAVEPSAEVESSAKVEPPVRVGPRTEMGAAMQTESLADYHLTYKSWSGMGPGNEFAHTSLRAVEVDLAQSRIRRLKRTASRPEPMLPNDDTGVATLLEEAEWVDLPAEQALVFQRAIRSWVDTEPPAEYSNPMALGRKAGHVTSLSVSWDGNTVTTALNPHAESGEIGSPKPPVQWNTLIGLLGVDEEAGRSML